MIGVILLNMGGPDSLDSVKPFLRNLFSDRDIIKLGPSFLQKPIASLIIRKRLESVRKAYSLIGGKSPLLDITKAQAKALEESLNSSQFAVHGSRLFKVYVGMRYWHPFIEDAVDHAIRDGISRILALSLYPHYSIATTGSSLKKFEDAIKKYHVDYSSVTSWFNHPLYINALVENIQKGLKAFDKKPVVLFSAHSLPQKFIDNGDPYVNEIQGTINTILKKIDIQWYLSYQSKTGPVKWLEPTTEHMLHELSEKGVKNLLVVPISFVSDHIETLYEIDILYKGMAKELGMNLKRIESLNTSSKFIEALADIVIKGVKDIGWI
ncbi:ferrochelatase [Dissulfurispira thermophila]|uniref:Ferrochelatase n=1 Tax=Dissulfurispira thermophila TaxID=2715679 RepID=A0A7G1H6G3_9BACT|nr:ferrochelatase [Dissulfurispira thermophila]BCB97337.1 ferrochelatase [Dissulfurispira thermophila]